MKQFQPVADLLPVRSETISVKEYLKLQAECPALIKRAEFVPPRIGGKGFGSFFVKYTRTRHKPFVYGQ
jgi:hypothetical protein